VSAKPRAAVVVAILLAVLLAHNLVLAVRNQLIFDRWHRTQRQLPTLVEIASASKNEYTRNGFAIYYLLREHIGGATVELALPFARITWWLRRVARLETVKGTVIRLADAEFAERAKLATVTRPFRVADTDYRVHFIFAGADERYAFVQRGTSREWLLSPTRLLAGEPKADEEKHQR